MSAPERLSEQFDPIRKSDLSSGDARRSRAVSNAEFQNIARQGAEHYGQMTANSSPPEALDKNFNAIVGRAHKAVSEPWGGATIDAHTGRSIPKRANAFAVTARPHGVDSVSIPAGADRPTLHAAMTEARQRFGDVLSRDQHHLGVFHDADKGTIDIDPVVVVKSREQAEAVGAYTRNVGGAYHFKSGDGFWPPHVPFGMPTRDRGDGKMSPQFDHKNQATRSEYDDRHLPPVVRIFNFRQALKKGN